MKRSVPQQGTKYRIVFDLLARPEGATRDEINKATGWNAFSYINDAKMFAARCGGTSHHSGSGGSRRFWIKRDAIN